MADVEVELELELGLDLDLDLDLDVWRQSAHDIVAEPLQLCWELPRGSDTDMG